MNDAVVLWPEMSATSNLRAAPKVLSVKSCPDGGLGLPVGHSVWIKSTLRIVLAVYSEYQQRNALPAPTQLSSLAAADADTDAVGFL